MFQFIYENGLEYHPHEGRRAIFQVLPQICCRLLSSCRHGDDALISAKKERAPFMCSSSQARQKKTVLPVA